VGQTSKIESAVIEYSDSRGFRKSLFKKTNLNFKRRSGKAKAVATKIAADDWERISGLFQENRMDNLSKLKAPTEKRFMTVRQLLLKITFKDETYKSPSFDHGFLKKLNNS
jgi:hypothetical protein